MAYVRGGSQATRSDATAGAATAAGTSARPQGGGAAGARSPLGGIWSPPPRPVTGEADDAAFDWDRVGIFGAGIAIGALLGAAITLFTAPVSGPDARRLVRRRARRAVWSGRDAWEDLRDELAIATRRKKKELRRRKRGVRAAWSDDTPYE